jgi:D-glycero-D-manno-heptose 1,7-bisphosphate phosphatase
MPAPLRPAIFLDRDGVIIENRDDYVKTLAEVQFIPGAVAALARLAALDWAIVIVTNQSPIGRGLVTPAMSEAINAHVRQKIEQAGGRVDGVYVCPHHPEAGCACRKPAPGLLLNAAADLGLDLAASVMIGDALTDVQAGQRAGTQGLLVLTGRGASQAPQLARAGLADVPVAEDLAAALAAWLKKTPPAEGGKGERGAILP